MRNKSVKELRNGEFASFPVEGIMWNFSRSLWQGHLLPGSVDGGTFSEELCRESGTIIEHYLYPLGTLNYVIIGDNVTPLVDDDP